MPAAAALLSWYEKNRRDLPWRRTRDAYPILVSEFMLQQTRVETVLPYYERFLERFPDFAALAAADDAAVLAAWSGLGYYRRARALHQVAREVAAAGGRLPETAAELARLPGIGPYTAAAVASIVFGEATPVVDGNVARVLARWRAVDWTLSSAAGRAGLAAAAATLLLPGRAADGNQAMMELGATLCSARAPACERCPLAGGCRAHQTGTTGRYPVARWRPAVRRQPILVALVEDRGRLLLFRRPPEEELLGGLWELPWAAVPARGGLSGALAGRYGGSWRVAPAIARLRHRITRHELWVEVRRARHQTDPDRVAEGPEAAWVNPGELSAWPVTGLVGKVLAAATPGADPPGCRARRRPGCTR